MRRRLPAVLFAGISTIAFASIASAADMPVKAKAPPPVVSYDWTGFYIGGYYGTGITHTKAETPGTVLGTHDFNQSGFSLGATAGYNWQFNPNWLVGLEGDIGYLGGNRTDTDWDDLTMVGVRPSWYGTVRGRLGYVTGPSLIYVTGGVAFVNVEDKFGGRDSITGQSFIGATTNSTTSVGGTFGAGIETKLSQNWSAKTEYLYIDAGSKSFLSNPFGTTGGFLTTFDHRFHMIKSGLNYKFGGPNEPLPFFNNAQILPSNHSWAGLYVGGNAGIGISNVRTIGGEGAVPFNTEQDVVGSGFTAGGQVGYNYMLTPRYVVGVEGDIGYLGLNHGDPGWNDFGRPFSNKTNWYGTARARLGLTTGPALLYITGGGAWVNLTDTIMAGTLQAQTSRTGGGWTFGGGTEVALDPRWSARLEALYMDVGRTSLAIGAVNTEFKDRFTVVRAGLSYKLTD